MDNITDFNSFKNNLPNGEKIKEDFMNQNKLPDGFNEFAVFLDLPDREFNSLKPYILEEFEKAISNMNDSQSILNALQLSGLSTDDLEKGLQELNEKIDNEISDETYSKDKKDFLKIIFSLVVNQTEKVKAIENQIVRIPVEICKEGARFPEYAHEGDSGLDIYALNDYTIHPQETLIIPTGIKCAIPKGYEIQIRPRSGLSSSTTLRVANSPATIDSGYRKEIGVIIQNTSPEIKNIDFHYDEDKKLVIDSIEKGENQYITKGMRFAQMVVCQVSKGSFYKVDSVEGIGEDRGGGFGSTGLMGIQREISKK